MISGDDKLQQIIVEPRLHSSVQPLANTNLCLHITRTLNSSVDQFDILNHSVESSQVLD